LRQIPKIKIKKRKVKKFFKKINIQALSLIVFLFFPQLARAEFLRPCAATGNCGVCDIVTQFTGLGKILIAGSAAAALFVIIWASVGMIISSGSSEKIQNAKNQIIGAVVGVVLVFTAFQIVSLIIFTFAVPSDKQGFAETESEKTEQDKFGSLKNFLGVAWWNICDEKELVEKKGIDTAQGSTANCKYWGDGTPCDQGKACCVGECKPAPCVPPASIKKYVKTQYDSSDQGIEEKKIRTELRDGGVIIHKEECIGGNTTNCANVAGLPQKSINKLIEAAGRCNSNSCQIIITGGTEGGHNTHGPGKDIVDIDYSSKVVEVLQAIGLKKDANFGEGFTCEKFIIEKEKRKGIKTNCIGGGAEWIHICFGQPCK